MVSTYLLCNKGFWVHSRVIQKQDQFSIFTDHLTVELLENIFHNSDWYPQLWVRNESDFAHFLCITNSVKAFFGESRRGKYFFNCIDKAFDTYSNYDNVLPAGDFNAEDDEPYLSNFLYQHDLYNLVKVGICFKNSSKRTSIDFFLTTKNTCFQNIVAVCDCLSVFHKLVLTVLKTSSDKNKPCEILYREYKNFNSESFN